MYFLVFKLADLSFAIEIDKVNSIANNLKVTKVPLSQSYIEGLINIKGGIKILANIGKILNIDVKLENNNKVILLKLEEEIAILVTDVIGVLEIDEFSEDIRCLKFNLKENLLEVDILDVDILDENL